MSQNDLVIDNQSFPATRADINSALQAIGSLSSGPTAPPTTYANMLWYDTGTNTLKMRSEANSVWISVGYLDQSSNAFRIFDDTQVVNSSGTQTGIIGDQATATWEAGTSTTESLVSPAKVKAAIEALVPAPTPSIGESQSWAVVSRTSGTSYQNTTGRSIQVAANLSGYNTGSPDNLDVASKLEVSSDNSTWIEVGRSASGVGEVANVSPIIPNNYYYKYTGIATFAILS